MSTNFGPVDLANLPFPATMRIDYIRVYQHPDQKNVGCDPADFPTKAYIDQYIEAYTNPNLTTWKDDFVSSLLLSVYELILISNRIALQGQPFPKNSYLGQC